MKLHTIELEVNGQVIICNRPLALASDTIGKIDVVAMFDDRWEEYDSFAFFFANCKTKKRIAVSHLELAPDYTIEVEVPKEVLADLGDVSVSIVGYCEESGCVSSRLTTFTGVIATITEKFNFISEHSEHKCLCDKDRKFYDLSLSADETTLSLCYKGKPISTVFKGAGVFKYMNRKSEWLWETDFPITSELYNNAYDVMEREFKGDTVKDSKVGNCSAVYKDGMFGKNLDWLYDETAVFAVRTGNGARSSIGLSGGINTLTRETMSELAYTDDVKLIPFMVNDGVNDKGVFVGLNVVPNNETKDGVLFTTPTTGTNPSSTEPSICVLMLPRYILDNYDSAEEAVSGLSNLDIYCPHTDKLSEEIHLFIGDSENRYIVEFINNELVVIDVTGNAEYMTNYYRSGTNYVDNKVDWHTLTDHPNGVHRGNIIADSLPAIRTNYDLLSLLSEELDYTNMYKKKSWRDEYCGNSEKYGNLTYKLLMERPSAFDEIALDGKTAYDNRTRTPESEEDVTWESVHSAVFDLEKKVLLVKVKDETVAHTFSF